MMFPSILSDIKHFFRSKPRGGGMLIVLVISLVLMSISLGVVVPRAKNDVKRRKEGELRFILGEFRRAIRKFKEENGENPQNVSELIQDSKGNRFLRKVYLDPFTKKRDWVFSIEEGNPVVHSSSDKMSISGLPYSQFK